MVAIYSEYVVLRACVLVLLNVPGPRPRMSRSGSFLVSTIDLPKLLFWLLVIGVAASVGRVLEHLTKLERAREVERNASLLGERSEIRVMHKITAAIMAY